jgi:hypothetical protein
MMQRVDSHKIETVFFVLARLWKSLPLALELDTWWPARLRRVAGVLAALAGVAWVRRQMARKCAAQRIVQEIKDIEDPTFGPSIVHDMHKPDSMYEAFLDSLHLQKDSPMRGHLCQLFRRPNIDEQLRTLFDQVSGGNHRISREGFMWLSRGINGHLHQLLKGRQRMPLAACTPEDQKWIFRHFDHFFPPERPLDRQVFPGFFKLVLMRRIVRTLVAHIGLSSLRRGTSAPLVLIVGVDLGGGLAPFRLNTVTPNGKTVLCGESLALVEETSQEFDMAPAMPEKTLCGMRLLKFFSTAEQ